MSDKIITIKQTDTGDRLLPKTVKEAILDLEIDQEFNAESVNPQSGVAIKGALSDVAFSGSYDDLENKPTIPSAQVQADWNESSPSSKAYIQNKPTIPAAQVQADWNETDTTSRAYILNKPTIPSSVIVDQVYDSTSVSAQSGVAINGAKFVRNTATGGSSLILEGHNNSYTNITSVGLASSTSGDNGTAIGTNANSATRGTSLGSSSQAGQDGVAIGYQAISTGGAIQIGNGTNNTSNSLQIGSYQLLDTSTGLIPSERLNTTAVYPVIQVYKSGNDWYRIYAPDNTGYRWCEMGGLYYQGSTMANTDNTINFLKNFNDLTYTFIPTPLHSSANLNQYQMYEKYTERTTSSTVLRITSAVFGYAWTACGHIANEV